MDKEDKDLQQVLSEMSWSAILVPLALALATVVAILCLSLK